MPVFILLDHSLGMAQKRSTSDGNLETLFNFGQRIVRQIFEHLRAKNPLEVVQLFLFSSEVHPFSELVRDTEPVLQALLNFNNFASKAELSVGIEHIKNIIAAGSIGNCKNILYDVIVISRQIILTDPKSFKAIQEKMPFPQHCYFHFVSCDSLFGPFQTEVLHNFSILQKSVRNCQTKAEDVPQKTEDTKTNVLTQSLSLNKHPVAFTKIIPTTPLRDANTTGSIVTGKNEAEISQKLSEILNKYFVPLPLQMICGTLSGRLSLFPTVPNTEAYKTRIYLQGFLPATDISNCTILSKHLVQPIPDTISEVLQKNGTVWPKNVLNYDLIENEFQDPSKRPHFCVLLKKSLIKSKCSAICTIDAGTSSSSSLNSSIFAYIMPQTDENAPLQLCLLDGLPEWIDDLNVSMLKNVSQIVPPKKIDSSRAVLLHESIVQTDIAKIFRYARRLPDRRDAVLAEMEKFIKLVRSCYFQGLGIMLIAILERELSQPETKAEYLAPIIAELKLELGL